MPHISNEGHNFHPTTLPSFSRLTIGHKKQSLTSNMSSSESFPYPPLPPSVDAIRILTIEPGTFTDPLKCTLATAPFSTKPRYAALSYTWGLPYPDLETLAQAIASNISPSEPSCPRSPDLTTLTINAHPFQIHSNLLLALLHIRSKTHPLHLWIDAICINQSDMPERNAQVAMMSFIYSRAQKVIAWLGLREINPAVPDPVRIMAIEWEDGTVGDLAASIEEVRKPTSSREPGRSSFDFPRIAMSSYWTRLWIVQEACLARELVFVFGAKMWRFEEVERWEMLEYARKLAKEVGREVTGNERVEARGMLKVVEARVGRHTEAMRFESLVERFVDQRCQEARDRLFALLGLATDIRASAGDGDGLLEVYLEPLDSGDSFGKPELKRGSGTLRVDYSRSNYDIWEEAVKAVFFRVRPITSRIEGLDPPAHERSISIVRTAGVIQAALGGNVELEFVCGTQVTPRPIIQAMGYLAGEITQLGPDYSSLVGSFRAQQEWLNTCELMFNDPHDLEIVRAVNDSYSARILGFGDRELNRITEIRSYGVVAWQGERTGFHPDHAKLDQKYRQMWDDARERWMESVRDEAQDGPRICIGTEHLVALVPPSAAVGDVVVRFWNCDAALIMRLAYVDELQRGGSVKVPYFLPVGRADVADGDGVGNRPANDGRFFIDGADENKRPVWVNLGLGVLQILTASIRTYSS